VRPVIRVLVVEDDPALAELLLSGLRDQGMVVDAARDGAEALIKTETVRYDVVVLDRDLPVVHGDEVCRALVRTNSPSGVLMLTAADGVDNRVEGLLLGADDYLPKPFAFSELVARIIALSRRGAPRVPSVLRRGDIVVDGGRHEVRRGHRMIHLTRKEFGVLAELMRAEGQLVSAEQLLDRVWDENTDPFTNAVRTTMKNLRAKLGKPDPIVTVVGRGYRLP
jgi:DNA-binding response OmpR family regulator